MIRASSALLVATVLTISACAVETDDDAADEITSVDEAEATGFTGGSFLLVRPGEFDKSFSASPNPTVLIGLYPFTSEGKEGLRIKVVNQLSFSLKLKLSALGVTCPSGNRQSTQTEFTVPANSTGPTVWIGPGITCGRAGERVTIGSATGQLKP